MAPTATPAELRDEHAADRDDNAGHRDDISNIRDQHADQRDARAEQRDRDTRDRTTHLARRIHRTRRQLAERQRRSETADPNSRRPAMMAPDQAILYELLADMLDELHHSREAGCDSRHDRRAALVALVRARHAVVDAATVCAVDSAAAQLRVERVQHLDPNGTRLQPLDERPDVTGHARRRQAARMAAVTSGKYAVSGLCCRDCNATPPPRRWNARHRPVQLRLERVAVAVLLVGQLRHGSCGHRQQRWPQIHW